MSDYLSKVQRFILICERSFDIHFQLVWPQNKTNHTFIATMDTSKFNDEVYQVVNLIPKGRVTSYGAIAKALGYGTARMVGHAMSIMDHHDKTTPAQRVVNSSGHISPLESSGGRWRVQMLEKEGVEIKNGKVAKFKELFWDPSKEIE